MLRHIISVSLAMTACATLIPIKVNAATFTVVNYATLTVTPLDTLRKKTGDSIKFRFSVTPSGITNNSITPQFLSFTYDNSELSFEPPNSQNPLNVSGTETAFQIVNTQTIVDLTFKVLQPRKDGQSDLFDAFAWYKLDDSTGDSDLKTTFIADGSFDVEPVPEPLTMFGAAAALGYGAIFKRKYSKNTKF
jgi:hypothetical protein